MRRDALLPESGLPGSDPATVVEDLFDRYGVTRGILMGGDILGLGALPDPDVAAAMASAYNDWLVAEWLEFDERFRAALVVAPQDPAKGAAEIERHADTPGVAAILLPLTNRLMGDRHYYPIYEAAANHGLPVSIHPNAVDAIYNTAPTLAGGVPTYYTEWHSALTQIFQANVISLVCHGVFERYPGMKVVLAEGGIAWLMDVMWRLDKDWRGLRDEIPWVKRPPSEYIVEHVRLTTQPFIEPEKKEHLGFVLDAVHAGRTLMFSSDYPHWDFDNPLRALASVPDAIRDRIQWETATELYGGRL
jgi:predicted TIM-barrel fold metal-dependent hydrolase